MSKFVKCFIFIYVLLKKT